MDVITIPYDEYRELLRNQRLLNALRNAGVGNWEWYDLALESIEDN